MDTNNRQNQSTQNNAEGRSSRYAPQYGQAQGAQFAQRTQGAQHERPTWQQSVREGASAGRHERRTGYVGRTQNAQSAQRAQGAQSPQARPDALVQNTAFGTSKNPEGFVATWKNSTHTWRWRAVLCVFLALLLVMMQPTGTALYRSWNASNGEMMGLAAAAGTDDNNDKDLAATAEDSAADEPADEPGDNAGGDEAGDAGDNAGGDQGQGEGDGQPADEPGAPAGDGNGDTPAAGNNDNNNGGNDDAVQQLTAPEGDNGNNDANNNTDNNGQAAGNNDNTNNTNATPDGAGAATAATGKDKKPGNTKDTDKSSKSAEKKEGEHNYGFFIIDATGDTPAKGAAVLYNSEKNDNFAAVSVGTNAEAGAPFVGGFNADGLLWKVWALASLEEPNRASDVTANPIQGTPTINKAAQAAGTAEPWDSASRFFNENMKNDGTIYVGISPAVRVEYNANGGEGSIAPVVLDASINSDTRTATAEFATNSGAALTRDGYHLIGWSLNADTAETASAKMVAAEEAAEEANANVAPVTIDGLIPLNADSAAIAEALGHQAQGAINADGKLTGNVTLYAVWAEGDSDTTFTYTYTLMRDKSLGKGVKLTVSGIDVPDEGTEVTIESDVELTYEDVLDKIKEETEITATGADDEENAEGAEGEGEDAAQTDAPALMMAAAVEDQLEDIVNQIEPEWTVTNPEDAEPTMKVASTGAVFTAGADASNLIAQGGTRGRDVSAHIHDAPGQVNYHADYKDAESFRWAKEHGTAPASQGAWEGYWGIETSNNWITNGIGAADWPADLESGTSANGNLGAVTWLDDATGKDHVYTDAWTGMNVYKGKNTAWALGYKLRGWLVVAPSDMYEAVTTGFVNTANSSSSFVKGDAYTDYSLTPSKSWAQEVTSADKWSGDEASAAAFNFQPAISIGENSGKYYDVDLYANWVKRTSTVNPYTVYVGEVNATYTGYDVTGEIDGKAMGWDDTNVFGSAENPFVSSTADVRWTLRPVSGGAIQSVAVKEGVKLTAASTLGAVLNPDMETDPKVDPYSKTSGYYTGGGDLGCVAITPAFVIEYNANGGTGSDFTSLDAYIDGDIYGDFENGIPALKDITDTNIKKNNSQDSFIGWAVGSPSGSVIKKEDIDPNKNLSEYSEIGESYFDSYGAIDCLVDSITLYAIWGDSNTYEYNVANASNADVDIALGDADPTASPAKPATVVGGAAVTMEYAGASGTTYNDILADDVLAKATFAQASGSTLTPAEFAAKYRTSGFDGVSYSGEPAQISWSVKDDSNQPVTGANLDGALPEADATFTATVEPAKYDITLVPDTTTGTFKKGSYEITKVIVKGVPYGKAYNEIKFDINDAVLSDSNKTLTVTYNKDASDTIETPANAGAGKGKYFYDSTNNAYVEKSASNTWPGEWSPAATGTVTGNATLTYSYAGGFYKLTYALDGTPKGATNGQTTADAELSKTEQYIGVSDWNATYILGNDGTKSVSLQKKSATAQATYDAKYTGALEWPTTLNGFSSTADYTVTAKAILKSYDVTLTVGHSGGATGDTGLVKLMSDGNPTADPTKNSNVVGTVLYGNWASNAINSTVIGTYADGKNSDTAHWGVEPVYKAGYVLKWKGNDVYTWDDTDSDGNPNDPNTTAITANTTFVMSLAPHPYDLQVTMDGGTLNGDSNTKDNTITIVDVPYLTNYTDVKYTKSGSTYTYDKNSSTKLDGTLAADTAHGRNADGAWTPANLAGTMPAENSEVSYEFGRDTVTVKFVIADGGTWDGTSDTITGTVLYGKKLSTGTDTTVPNVYNIVLTKAAQYAKPTSGQAATLGTWSAVDPGTDPTVAPASKTGGNWVQTYTYTLATRTGYTVKYVIPSDYQAEVEFATGTTTDGVQTDSHTTWGEALSAPTAIKALGSYGHFSEKYNANIVGWTPVLDSSVGAWNNNDASAPVMTQEYEAVLSLKSYHVSYSIVNGTWGSNVGSPSSVTVSGAMASDSTDYHYGDKPSTTALATLASSGTWADATSTVQPGATYKMSNGNWTGVWKMKVGTGSWTDLPTGASTPSDVDITDNTEFQLTLTRVVSVTFASDNNSIDSGGPNVAATEYYAGTTLAVPSVTDNSITAKNSTVNHTKTNGNQSGYWDPALPSDGKVPDSATAITYTYYLRPVYVATYNVEHGTWNGETGSAATAAKTQEVFDNETLVFPASTRTKTVYNTSPTWYVGPRSANVTTGTSGIKLTADTSYLAYHAPLSGVTCSYKVRFHVQNVAKNGYDTVDQTVTGITPGDEITLAWSEVEGIWASNSSLTAIAPAADLNAAFAKDETQSEVGDGHSKLIEDDNVVFDVWYNRNSFDLGYSYSYPDNDSTNDAYSGIPALPNSGATTSVAYGATITPDPAAANYASGVNYLTFGGWKDGSSNPPATMPARNVTLTGAWTRNAATVKAVNAYTGSATGNGTISASGYSNNNIVLTGLKYGDTITWPEITKTPSTTDTFFGGWEYPAGTNIGDSLPTTVNSLNMEVNATWSTGIRIQYLHDTATPAVGTFTEYDSGYLQPAAGTNYVAIPAFSGGTDTTATNAPNAGKPKAEPGYIFQNWTWTEGATSQTSANVTQPKSGNTTIPLTFRATYLGTQHSVTYNVNGGAQLPGITGAIEPTGSAVLKRTGDTIYLPDGTTQLTRAGCTLAGYEITVGGTPISGGLVSPGTSWKVPAGTGTGDSSDYTDAISITAKWTVKVTFATNAPSGAGLSSTGVPAAVTAANAANTAVSLGATVNIPTVTEDSVTKTIANATVNTGYHFSGYTASPTLDPALTKSSTSFTVPSATTVTFPSDGVTVTAKWAIDQYQVTWAYDDTNHSTHNDYDFTSTTASTIDYGATGTNVQTNTAPTLKEGGTASTLNTDKYTAGPTGIDWYLVNGTTRTKVKLTDITFGTPFWITSDNEYSATDPGNGTKFEWNSGTEQALTFVGIPKITEYTITAQVTNGTMTNPSTSATGQTSVSYTKPYGTSYRDFIPESIDAYDFKSGTGTYIQYDPNAGAWDTDLINYAALGNPVVGNRTFTYSFTTLKSYNVVYELATTADADEVELSTTTATANYGANYSFPTLQKNNLSQEAFDAKYFTGLTWVLKKDNSEATTAGTYTDASVDASTSSTYPKTVTFVGTPQTKSYTVKVAVSGGTFKSTDGVVSGVRTENTNAIYGKKLRDYLPNVTDGTKGFTGDNSPTVTSGHWEYGGAKVDPDVDTVQYTNATYTYVFDTMRTVTMKTEFGDFATGSSPKVYYVADDLKDASDATLLSAVDAGGNKVFANEAALKAAYKLAAQASNSGYTWNETGWTVSPNTASYLTAIQQNPDESALGENRNYPNGAANIGADVTYTYTFAAKPVSVKFIQMFQKSDGTGYEMLETGSATATTNAANARSVLWTGTYDPNTTPLSSWAGRILDPSSDASLVGYVVTPEKATEENTYGSPTVTDIPQTDINDPTTTTYYLWYNRIPITINYSYTNAAQTPAGANAALPSSVNVIYGQTPAITLANPKDDTYAKALDGWYLKNEPPFINVSTTDPIAALGGTYNCKPEYSGTPSSLTMTLLGTWDAAKYTVTYENAKTGGANDDDAKFTLNGTEYAAGESATTNPILFGDTLDTQAATVAVSFADQYSFVGWELYVRGTRDTTYDDATDHVIKQGDLANVVVSGPGYVLKPVFKLNKITVSLSGGTHQTMPAIEGLTTWTVNYGDVIQLPNAAAWTAALSDTSISAADRQWINDNIDANKYMLPYDEDRFVVRPQQDKQVTTPSAWTKVGGNTTWTTTGVEATENATYEYYWEDIKYTIHYMNVGGENSEIYGLTGKFTAHNLTWTDSVFDDKLSNTADSGNKTVKEYYADQGVNVLDPKWTGHTFHGWKQGTATKAGKSTIVYPGNDITVSAAHNPDYMSGNNDTDIYLWAFWEGDSKTVTFHKNAGETTETTSTQAIEIDTPTNLKAFNEMVGFTRAGYQFNGWTKEVNKNVAWSTIAGTDKWTDKAQYTVQETASADDLNLYANWTPNTYKVRFAYFDGTYLTNADVLGSTGADKDDPYEQVFTCGASQGLQTAASGGQTLVDLVNATTGTHNPKSDMFDGWSYGGKVLAENATIPDDSAGDLTTRNNGTVTLKPVAKKSVKLTYEKNSGTEEVTGMPSPLTASSPLITDSTSPVVGYGEFTLPATDPVRTGYTFKGWKVPNAVDASGTALSGNLAGGTTIYLSGDYAAYLAYAQWEAQVATTYTIEKRVQHEPGSSTYDLISSETKNATSGTYVEIGSGDLADYVTALEGYTYMPGISTTGTYIAAGGTSKIVLKYNVQGFVVSYAFTEGGLPLTGDVAGATPYGTGSTVTVTSATPNVKLKLTSDATLPEGYKIVDGHGGKWDYDASKNSLRTADGTSLITAATVDADGTTEYKVVDDTTLTLPIEKLKYTVTFAIGDNTLWSDGTSTGTVTKSNVLYGSKVDPADEGATVKPTTETGYGFGGWKYQNTSDATDPLNGTIVDPANTPIKGNITFTASHYPSFTVTWSAGGHSKSGFSNTPENQRLFKELPATGYAWRSTDPGATATNVAGLQLEPADMGDGGTPRAEDGYQFAGWTVNGGTTKYLSLDDLYDNVAPNQDYTIEAQWTKLTQTVLFDPNVTGGAKAGQLSRAIQGPSGENVLTDGTPAMTPSKPEARAGYVFDCWQLGDGASAVRLGENVSFTFPMNPMGKTDTYVAQWSEAVIDILTDTQGHGTIVQNQPTTGIKALDTSKTYTMKANPDPGWKFDHWETSTSTNISTWYSSSITDKTQQNYGLLEVQPVDGAYEAATLTAVFVEDPYQVTFQNSATPGEGTISVSYAPIGGNPASYELVGFNGNVSTTTVSATGTMPGYRFVGWTYEVWPETADADGVLHTATTPTAVTTPVPTEDLGTVPIIGRTVFTAKYEKNPASLNYHKNAAAATGSIGSETGKETGDTVTLPSEGFTWTGHELIGWVTAQEDADGNAIPASMTQAEFDACAYKAGACGDSYALKGGEETLYAVYLAATATLVYDNNAVTKENLAKHATKDITIKASEDATALTVAAVNWDNGNTLATQPGRTTDDASAINIPGAAREFVGWSFDPNAVEGGSSTIFKPGDTIPSSYLPAEANGSVTIYAIWKDKKFKVSLYANGGNLKEHATAPATPLVDNVTYGDIVSIPELMFERPGHNFRYWLANDGVPTRVSDSSGAAASYKFVGTNDVTLTATWVSTGDVTYEATLMLKDEKGRSLTGANVLGPYSRFDTPLADGAYENLTVTSASPLETKDTSDYFTFEGWYIYNEFKANQLAAETKSTKEVLDLVKMWDGVRASSLPTYWDTANNKTTEEFDNNSPQDNLLTLYAKKRLDKYDISFDPNIPSGSGYTETDVDPIADMTGVKVSGETRSLSSTYALPGYKFLGWLKTEPANHDTTTQAAYDASSDKVAKNHDLSTPLLPATSTDYQVKLYAAWADTDNSVSFVSAYDGDGVRSADAGSTETVHATQQHKTWKEELEEVAALTAHPENEYALFTGWYTVNGVQVDLASCKTVADILALDTQLAPEEDGSYNIKLYAHYSFRSARVIYNGDSGAIAPSPLPDNQAKEIPETGSVLPAAKITLQPVSSFEYKKTGYHMDGWEGKGNDGTYNNENVAGGYYNKVWYDNGTAGSLDVLFDYAAAGMVVNVYPHFAANEYTVNYEYTLPENYSSYVMNAAVPGKDADSNNVASKTGLGWTTGSVYDRNLFTTPPVLEGYDLTGWKYETKGHKEVIVQRGWTVEDLVAAAAAADGLSAADAEEQYKDASFDLKAVWTPKTYSVAYDADGGTLLSNGLEPGTKTGISWEATVDAANDRLLIEESKLNKPGYSNPVWYVDQAKGTAANTSTGGDTPTFGQLVYLWHQAKGDAANVANIYTGAEPLMLYAGWDEDTVTVIFTVSNPESGWISNVSIDGANTPYADHAETQLAFTVGAKTGNVTFNGTDTGKTIDDVVVTVAADEGYSVTSWTFGTTTVKTLDAEHPDEVKTYSVPASTDRYVGGTYEAQIEGDPNVGITLRYFDMDETGAYPASPTANSTGLTAKDFLNADGGIARVGDTIPAANLGAVRTGVDPWLSLDTGALADLTVKADAASNTADLYYKRATVDVNFKWEWPDGKASATPPKLPADLLSVYYGSTQNTPAAPTAPKGYTWEGWFVQGSDTALGSTFTVDDLEGMTVVGKFKKASFEVTFTGVYEEDGITPVTEADAPTLDPVAGITRQVEFGSTVGTDAKILLTDTATTNTIKDIALGMQTGPADLTVSYDSSKYAISWVYKKDGSSTWVATADPTTVKIEGATEFRAVVSKAQVISYLAGDHGAFSTAVADGTRAESVTAPYNMADYLYDEASADGKKISSGPMTNGLPTADPGWQFTGWTWEYALPSGYPQTGATPALEENATAVQKMHAGVEDITNVVHGIALTAQWEPSKSYLALDENDAAPVFDERVQAKYASGYKSPEGLQPTYDEELDNAVTLPDATQLTRNGFTLKGWTWETDDGTYEYEPGAKFQMPGSDKTTADDPAVTLVAQWEEEYVTINYFSSNNARGTVNVKGTTNTTSETIGTWSGKKRGGAADLKGANATPATHYNFTKWTRGSVDGTVMTDATGLQPDNSLVPVRNTTDKRYDAADYYATFTGDVCYVTFIVDPASVSPVEMGTITIAGFSEASGQKVPYGDKPVMSGKDYEGNTVSVVAKPKSASFDFADGRYWDYYVNTGTASNPVWQKKGSTTDPSTVTITAETQFRVNFKKSTGKYKVMFDVRGGIGSFDPVYKAWGDANVGAGKTPRRYGYTFNGWFATPYGNTFASATDRQPGMYEAVSKTYGELAGGDRFAEKAAKDGITLLAGWNELSGFALTLNGNGGMFANPESNTKKVEDLKWTSKISDKVTSAMQPKRDGYEFTGWSTTPNGANIASDAKYCDLAGTNDTAPGSVVLYAQWKEKTYKVKYVNYPLSQDDPIAADGSNSIVRELKYSDIVAMGEPFNSKPDDRVWDCWKVSTGNSASPNVSLTGANANWTVGKLEKENAAKDGDAFVVYGTWTNYITYTTTYILYEDTSDNPGIGAGDEPVGDDFRNPKTKEYLVVTDKALPNEYAVPNMVGHIPPGFELNEDMTVKYNNNMYGTTYASTADMKVLLNSDVVDPINFDVVVVAKTGYSLGFDLNDGNTAFASGYTHAAMPSADAGGDSYPTQVVKDFYKVHNVPWSVFATDNTFEGEALGDPTREGFEFGGWYNLVILDTDEPGANAIRSDAEIYYGDLAFNEAGEWYDPMVTNQGLLTLYARWVELQRTVHYIVADDMKKVVKIRLHSEDDSKFSTAERSETIGAATGDVFVNGTRYSSDQIPQGAVAKANRGYSLEWRIVVDDPAAQNKTYMMPLGTGVDNSTVASALTASNVVAAMSATAVEKMEKANGASMSAQADDTAKSTEGTAYSSSASITPAVLAEDGLFVGESNNNADTGAMGVLYVATATKNASANITFNPNGATTYNGPSKLTQPAGTYVGETADGDVWGVNDGELPDRNVVRRTNYVFNGWTSTTDLTYEDENGNIQTIPAGTVIVPGSWMANHLIVPEGGVTLTADWTKGKTKWTITVPEATNPNTGQKVAATSLSVDDGTVLTDDEIMKLLNRGGAYPDKWNVDYYDEDGNHVTKKMTSTELLKFLQSNPVVSDMTISVADDAKWKKDKPTPDPDPDPNPDPDDPTKPTSPSVRASGSAKTGDAISPLVSAVAGFSALVAAGFILLYIRRRRRDQ